MSSFGQTLKKLRENLRESRDHSAQSLGIKYSTYANYENDQRQPDFDTLKQIAAYFNVTTDYLLGQEPVEGGYYTDAEAAQFANEIAQNPDLKTLFDASRGVSKKDMQLVVDLVHRMKKEHK